MCNITQFWIEFWFSLFLSLSLFLSNSLCHSIRVFSFACLVGRALLYMTWLLLINKYDTQLIRCASLKCLILILITIYVSSLVIHFENVLKNLFRTDLCTFFWVHHLSLAQSSRHAFFFSVQIYGIVWNVMQDVWFLLSSNSSNFLERKRSVSKIHVSVFF